MANLIALVPRAGDDGAARSGARAVYTVVEVAQLLSLSRGSAYALVRNGTIPAIRLGSRWVVPRTRFHAWLDSLVDEANGDH